MKKGVAETPIFNHLPAAQPAERGSAAAGRIPVVMVVLVVAVFAFYALRQSVPGAAPPPVGIPVQAQAAVVDSVVDGDTLWVRPDGSGGPLPAGETAKIRLLEIDTPETQGPGGVECGGAQATDFARRRLRVGSTVHLVADREDTDQYGRFLRYLWTADGRFFNLDAVRSGHARAVLYEPNDAHIDQMRAAEAQAQTAGRGIWGAYCSAP